MGGNGAKGKKGGGGGLGKISGHVEKDGAVRLGSHHARSTASEKN